jgi:hypothetical protein
MEILLPTLFEFVLAAAGLTVILFGEVALWILASLLRLISTRRGRSGNENSRDGSELSHVTRPFADGGGFGSAPAGSRPTGSRAFRLISRGVLGLFVLTLAGMLTLNLAFDEQIVRWVINRTEAKTGIAFDFESADVNLFSGQVEIAGLKVSRPTHETSAFDLAVARTALDVELGDLMLGQLAFSDVSVEGVRGWYRRLQKPEDRPPRRQVDVAQLDIKDVELIVSDQTREPALIEVPLTVSTLRTSPLRSDWAAFDALFHTNAAATLDGHALQIESSGAFREGRFAWHAEHLPVALFASYFGRPWRSFEAGGIRLQVSGTTEGDAVGLDLSVQATGLVIREREDAGRLSKRLIAAIQKRLDQFDGALRCNVSLHLDEAGFEGELSPDAAALWDVLSDALADKVAEVCGVPAEKVRSAGRKALEGLRSLKRPAGDKSP